MNKNSSWEKVFGSDSDKAYFSRVDRKPPKQGRAFVGWLFFLLLLAGAGMIVSSIVFGGDKPTAKFGERVVITSDAPASVQPGKEFVLTLEIKNNESTALKNTRLSVRIPEG